MIKYRLLCFWAATAVAASSIGLAQTSPAQPAATPAETSPASAVSRGLKPAEPAKSKQRSATSVKTTSTEQQTDPAAPAETPAQIAIVELPSGSKSDVIRKVVELLEKQGIAKQVSSGVPTRTTRADLFARIAATPDVKTEEAIALVKSLQGHGIVRMSFVKPTDNRNVVTVLAPADTPWPVIDNIRIMVNAQKRFSVDVQIATQAQTPETVRGGSYNPRGTSRYGYSARPGEKASATTQIGSASSTPLASSDTTVEKRQQPVSETRIFMLKYVDANVLSKTVSQLFDKSFGIVPDVRTNSVIVRGAPSQVREMEALVQMLDSQQAKRLPESAAAAGGPNASTQQNGEGKKYSAFYVDVPSVAPSETRIRIQELDRQTNKAAESLRWFLNGLEEPAEDDGERKAELRKVVRKTFLARQELQRAELAEFAARLKRIQQTIAMRDKIADKIIDRRVEELLDPNLKWDVDTAAGSQKTVTRTQSVVRKQSDDKELQPTPNQNSATVTNQTVVVSQTSEGTVLLRNAEKFRELLATHARRVAEVQATIEAWEARREDSRNAAEADSVLKVQNEELARAEANQKFAMKEYETQIRLLESEVETVVLILETAKQEMARAAKLVEKAALPKHELDQRKREVIAAEQRLEKANVLLDLYQDAAKGI